MTLYTQKQITEKQMNYWKQKYIDASGFHTGSYIDEFGFNYEDIILEFQLNPLKFLTAEVKSYCKIHDFPVEKVTQEMIDIIADCAFFGNGKREYLYYEPKDFYEDEFLKIRSETFIKPFIVAISSLSKK